MSYETEPIIDEVGARRELKQRKAALLNNADVMAFGIFKGIIEEEGGTADDIEQLAEVLRIPPLAVKLSVTVEEIYDAAAISRARVLEEWVNAGKA